MQCRGKPGRYGFEPCQRLTTAPEGFCHQHRAAGLAREAEMAQEAANAVRVNPETGEIAQDGYCWRRTLFGKLFQEPIHTPYTLSPRSETYWAS